MQGLVKSMSFSGEEKVNIYFHPFDLKGMERTGMDPTSARFQHTNLGVPTPIGLFSGLPLLMTITTKVRLLTEGVSMKKL